MSGALPIMKNSGLGRMSKAWARRLDRAKKPTMATMSQMSSSLNPTARSASASARSDVLGGARQADGVVDEGPPAVVERCLAPVDGDEVGDLGVLVADPQDRPVGDHAVGAAVGRRGGDDDQLAIGLRQRRGVLVHQQVVELEERPEQLGPLRPGR